jgi:hypothetical protein
MMGEVEDGADDGDDEDSKKSNCMYVRSFGRLTGHRLRDVSGWGYVRLARDNT